MSGLLDDFSAFASTPQGQGLLAAAFGGLAGARRGQPLNSIGRAGLSGLAGYTGAQDRITQEAESATQRKFREMQMQGLEAQMARQVAQDKWRAGLSDVLAPKPQEIDQFTGTTQMVEPSREVVQKYLMDPNSPFADKLLEQKLFPKGPDYKVVGDALVGIGPDGKVAPAYTAPPKPESQSSDVKNYQFAQGQGYKGTFEQYQKELRKSGATSINMGDNLGLKPKDRFEMEDKLRADYEKATTNDSEIVKTAADISGILDQNGALKDQAAIYKFAKALDPEGAVREADYAAIVRTAGGLDYVTALVNKAITGEQLSPKQRTEMKSLTNSMAKVATDRIKKQQSSFTNRATMYNLKPENVFNAQPQGGVVEFGSLK